MDTLYFVALEQNGRKIRKEENFRRILCDCGKTFFFSNEKKYSLIAQFEDIIFEGNRRVGQVLYF